jgi:catechol 2,3-dioxygenase-like lactoylglutathione lyase family enzyme
MPDVDTLFSGVPVRDFAAARAWYTTFFDREPDVVPHEREVMWRCAEPAWLYVVQDEPRAGNALVALMVADLDTTVAELARRGIEGGPAHPEGDGARKATFTDPDGNEVSLIEVPSST